MSMKLLFLIVCLVHSHGSSCATVEGKRYEYQSMVDPLTRRSPLDKNFMRFGRSSPATDDPGQFDEPTSTPQGHLGRDKNNFADFGQTDENDKDIDDFLRTERARQDSFLRFAKNRDMQNFMRFGRGRENFMRFGRGKNENFMRFGRGRNENFMRFGRGRNENFMRFGRGRNENFMRFGRGKNENFMRFGRGRNENFMRFGKSNDEEVSEEDLVPQRTIRSGGSRSTSNFMRFGRGDVDDNSDQVIKRSSRDQTKSNFLRFGRGNNDGGRNFMRFGRGEVDLLASFNQPVQSREKDDIVGFLQSEKEEDVQRAKRSAAVSENEYDLPIFQMFKDFSKEENDADQNSVALPYDLDEEYEGSLRHQEIWNRQKRSLGSGDEIIKQKSSKTFVDGNSKTDVIFKHVTPPLHYYPSPLSAGLPNFIVGPEFSLLPSLEVSSTKLKRGKIGDRNFIRLG